MDDKIVIYDYEFNKLDEIFLPQSMLDSDEVNRTFGYDISLDCAKIVYADDEGIKLLDLTTNDESMLIKTLLLDDPKWGLVRRGYFYPQFVDDDKKVIATRAGYERNDGYYCYNFAEETLTRYDSFEMISTDGIYFDTGMLAKIRTSEYHEDRDISNYIISYIDFNKSHAYDIEKEIIGRPNRQIVGYHEIYTGKNYAAFLTQYDDQEPSPHKRIYNIHLLDLATMEIQTNLLTVRGARLEILGVLENGKIIFFYDRAGIKSWVGVI